MRSFHSLGLLLIVVCIEAQEMRFTFDDFDLSVWEQSNPGHWCIDSVNFINGVASLHHCFDTTASFHDAAAFYYEPLRLDSAMTEWCFTIRYDYNPSASNNWAFWLTSMKGSAHLYPTASNQGYVLGVNFTGSDDFLRLWRFNGSATTISTGDFNWQEEILPGTPVRIRVTRNLDKEWQVYLDTSGTEFKVLEAIDSIYCTSNYSGIFYRYTATQDQKLWLDDVMLKGKFLADVQPPVAKHVEVIDGRSLLVTFDEEIDTTRRVLFVVNRFYKPVSLKWRTSSEALVSYDAIFSEKNLLEIYNVSDLLGNTLPFITAKFTYHQAGYHDVLITEIMADPTPTIGQPECEYIELFNRSADTVNLKNWKLVSGDRLPAIFPFFLLLPGKSVLVADDGCMNKFDSTLSKIPVSTFPALPNDGEVLTLYNQEGSIVHTIEYDPVWISDQEKRDGGWSMELMNLNYPCITKDNWEASRHESGGTPGQGNSLPVEEFEYPVVSLSGLSEITQHSLKATFTESLDSFSAQQVSNYLFLPFSFYPDTAKAIGPEYKEIGLIFNQPLSSKVEYTLQVNSRLQDCSGTSVITEAMSFGIPQEVDSADVVINEIMFDATDAIPEYIELFNASEKCLDLKDFQLGFFDLYADTIKSAISLFEASFQLMPEHYIVLTENEQQLLFTYPSLHADLVVEPQQWISLHNDGGKFALLQPDGSIMDAAIFSPQMHFSLLLNSKGVSLERISPEISGLLVSNWHSAATHTGYSTPAALNSQSTELNPIAENVSFTPSAISPDNNGEDDFLLISYSFAEQGFVCKIKIFNSQGALVRDLVQNELCALEGSYLWDGLSEEGKRLPMGYYIVYFEAWHPNGDRTEKRESVLMLPEKK